MQIKSSTDWRDIETELMHQCNSLDPGNKIDVYAMILNLSNMVSELSKLEVISRQSKRCRHLNAAISKVNEEIETVENLIFMGVLAQ